MMLNPARQISDQVALAKNPSENESRSESLMQLFGCQVGESPIQNFLSSLAESKKILKLGNSEKQAFNAIGNRPACEYRNYKELGVSFCFEASKLEALHIYNGTHGYAVYDGELPHGLSMSMNGGDIVRLLGEPDGKMGGGRGGGPISIAYKEKGLQINFLGGNWEDSNNLIDSVTIHEPLHP